MAKDHDPKHCKRPRSNALDAGKGVFPLLPLLHLRANLLRPLQNGNAALSSALREPERAQTLKIWDGIGRRCSEHRVSCLHLLREPTGYSSRNLLSHDDSSEPPDWVFGWVGGPTSQLSRDYTR